MRHVYCAPACLFAAKRKADEKRERKEYRERKQAMKRLADHKEDTQKVVNRYIRLRDADLPCISCGRHHQGQYHAGHYKSVGAHPELRFNELNIHKQCFPCNTRKGGNALEYRKGLIAKIGVEKVEQLEGPHPAAHYSVEDCKRIAAEYRQKIKQLQQAVKDRPASALTDPARDSIVRSDQVNEILPQPVQVPEVSA
jgi:hypothetical protein